MWHLTSRYSQIRNEHGKHWWSCTSHVTTPKYYYSPASYARSRWRKGRKSSTFWGLSKKFSTNSQVWEKLYLMSKWYMLLLRYRTTMSPSFRPSCLKTIYQLLTILQGSLCWRKLGGKEEVKFKMTHSWYFGNHIRHQGPMWPWPRPPDRIDQGRPQWNQGQPPDGRARRGTRNNCHHPEHWVRDCHFPRRNNQPRPFQRP